MMKGVPEEDRQAAEEVDQKDREKDRRGYFDLAGPVHRYNL